MKSKGMFLIILVILSSFGLVFVTLAAAGPSHAIGPQPTPSPVFAIEAGNFSQGLENVQLPGGISSIILYDQTDLPSGNGAPDQDFEATYDIYDSEGADDFVVPPSGWIVDQVNTIGIQSTGGTADTVDINIYPDSAGFPGTSPVCSYDAISITLQTAGDFEIALPTACELVEGTYWLAIQTNQNFDPGNGQHFWSNRTDQRNSESVWRNPNDGFGLGCTDWGRQRTCGVGGGAYPDFLFQVLGEVGVPSIVLTKTVGVDPGVCATTNSLTVTIGSEVAYCYQVENTSDVSTFHLHDLADSELGIILSDFSLPLVPGQSVWLTQTASILTNTENIATWTASNPPYVANDSWPFSFIDISGTGTALGLSDDGATGVTLPFMFNFYDVITNQMTVGNDGGVILGTLSGTIGEPNQPLPDAGHPLAIFPYWDDLDSVTGEVYTQAIGTAPFRQFIIEWFDRSHSQGSASGVTFQAILFESRNEILFQYSDLDFGNPSLDYGASATVGVNKDGAEALQYSYNTAILTDSLAILFAPQSVLSVTDNATATVSVVPYYVYQPTVFKRFNP